MANFIPQEPTIVRSPWILERIIVIAILTAAPSKPMRTQKRPNEATTILAIPQKHGLVRMHNFFIISLCGYMNCYVC